MNKREFRRWTNEIKRKFRFRSGLNFRRKRYRLRGEQIRFYGIWALEIVGVIVAAYLFTQGFGIRVVCSGESMETAIPENSATWVNRVAYRFSEPKTGDIIVFMESGSSSANYNTKRVVAVPGDTVLISNGSLYVNEKKIPLNKEETAIKVAGRAASEITLGKDEYFVLGDNVNNSEDSRYESIGNVKKSEIYGKVWFILSLRAFGFVS